MPDLAQREPTRDAARPDARSSGRTLGWCLLGGVVASLLPLPWSLASGAFYVAAAVAAVVTLVRLVRAPARRPTVLALVSGALVLSSVMALGVLLQLVLYPYASRLQECVRDSITVSGRSACQDELRQTLLDDLFATTR